MKISYHDGFITKKKEKSIQKTLKAKIWEVFRHWIYIRDNHTCYTCGKKNLSGKDCQAGHLFHGKLDYDPLNIHTQCYQCNSCNSGQRGLYTERIIKEHGMDAYDALKFRSNQIWKPSTPLLEDLLKYWEDELEKINNIPKEE